MRSACLPRASSHVLKLRQQDLKHIAFPIRTFTSNSALHGQPAANGTHVLDRSPKRVAILGGGITGLSTSWNVLRALPNAKITIYESTNRLGGWIYSEKVPVQGGEVLFEWGPRSLRPDLNGAGSATARLVEKMKLERSTVRTGRFAPAATNRFLYYPDHLVRMPSPGAGGFLSSLRNLFGAFATMMREQVFSGIWRAVRSEPFIDTRSPGVEDESVGDFIRRRFGQKIADNLLSAMFHGIYAGDIYNLSARTLLPKLWYMETRDPDGSGLIAEMMEMAMNKSTVVNNPTPEWLELLKETGGRTAPRIIGFLMVASVYTFQDGLGQLITSLESALCKSPNVSVRTDAMVTGLRFDRPSKSVIVDSTASTSSEKYDYVVSSLSPEILRTSTSTTSPNGRPLDASSFKAACVKANDASTVMVVNLYYSDPKLIRGDRRGFGYLLPCSVPLEQNPERALGVIFGSESSGIRGPSTTAVDRSKNVEDRDDELAARLGQDTALGTKLTVMLGGHWWDGWATSDIPSPEDAIQMSKTLLARHLKISDEPEVAKARLAKNAIPQYRVGYRKTMDTIHRGLMAQYEGRLKVAGPWWQGGVGINDCVLKAHQTAINIGKGWDERTGLELYGKKEQWYLFNLREGTMRLDDPSVDR